MRKDKTLPTPTTLTRTVSCSHCLFNPFSVVISIVTYGNHFLTFIYNFILLFFLCVCPFIFSQNFIHCNPTVKLFVSFCIGIFLETYLYWFLRQWSTKKTSTEGCFNYQTILFGSRRTMGYYMPQHKCYELSEHNTYFWLIPEINSSQYVYSGRV